MAKGGAQGTRGRRAPLLLAIRVVVAAPPDCCGLPGLSTRSPSQDGHHLQRWLMVHRRHVVLPRTCLLVSRSSLLSPRLLLPPRERTMSKIIVIAIALIFAVSARAEPRSGQRTETIARCLQPAAAEASAIESKWKVAQDVLCCCKTHSGGECCARVAVCAGRIAGCFCSSPVAPGARPITPQPPQAPLRQTAGS
jgi:hypothetical protein